MLSLLLLKKEINFLEGTLRINFVTLLPIKINHPTLNIFKSTSLDSTTKISLHLFSKRSDFKKGIALYKN